MMPRGLSLADRWRAIYAMSFSDAPLELFDASKPFAEPLDVTTLSHDPLQFSGGTETSEETLSYCWPRA